jgi:hypothetical protein
MRQEEANAVVLKVLVKDGGCRGQIMESPSGTSKRTKKKKVDETPIHVMTCPFQLFNTRARRSERIRDDTATLPLS